MYSLGVPNPDTGLLAVHVVASDAELAEIEAGGGEAASRRVAEALLFVTSMTMLKATGQVNMHSIYSRQPVGMLSIALAQDALLFLLTFAFDWLQTSSMTLSRLDAAMWENPESAGSLQQRLLDELAVLPINVLGSMVSKPKDVSLTSCITSK